MFGKMLRKFEVKDNVLCYKNYNITKTQDDLYF